jgi:hypothetical protein
MTGRDHRAQSRRVQAFTPGGASCPSTITISHSSAADPPAITGSTASAPGWALCTLLANIGPIKRSAPQVIACSPRMRPTLTPASVSPRVSHHSALAAACTA